MDVYLKRKFDNEKLRVPARPTKQDSVEAYLGEEFIGVLFLDDQRGGRSYIFEMPILEHRPRSARRAIQRSARGFRAAVAGEISRVDPVGHAVANPPARRAESAP